MAEIKIDFERKGGELIQEQFPHGGDRKSESSLHRANLKDVGIEYTRAHRWQAKQIKR